MHKFRYLAFASTSLLSLATPALAQSAIAPDTTAEAPSDIVVTGTLIRGIAPGGSQSITVDQEQIKSVGAANTSDLLASLPAAGNFLSFVGVRGASNFSLAVNRPSLRYLGNTGGSTGTTLLLLNGHRLPGMGINQSSADVDAIAAGAIGRVEIVTDGGSSTYGSDAVGGVINFITRKDLNGIEAKASYGLGKDYRQANAALTAGKVWDNASALVSYDYSWHDEIYGADRDWSQNTDWINGLPAELGCTPGNIQAGGSTYSLPGLVKGFGNRCDNTELQTFYPRETKHSVFASFDIDDGGPVSFSMTAFYLNRKSQSDGGPLVSTGTNVPVNSPYYVAIPGVTTTETFLYNLSSVFGNSTSQVTKLESWGITPSMKIDLGSSWQLNAMANYGRGDSRFVGEILNPTPIALAATGKTFNPASLGAATNAATLATAKDWYTFGKGTNELVNARLVLDGSLFALPAGDVKVAVGGEYLHESYSGAQSRGVSAAGITALPNLIASRSVKAAFGEINVPLLGEGVGPFHSLTFTASGRYDDYSDFGHTFNPKFGLTFEPVEWLKLRGTWSKAFQAPGLSDLAQAATPAINILPLAVRNFVKPGLAAGTTGRNILYVMGGTKLPLNPQKATTWSVGFDMKVPVISGLLVGATYYNIKYNGSIAGYPIFDPAFYTNFPDQAVSYDQGDAALLTKIAEFNALVDPAVAAAKLAQLPLGIQSVYAVLDGRSTNLGSIKTSGVDFYARYNRETGFGGVYFDVSGTYITAFKTQSYAGGPITDTRALNFTKLRTATTLGTDIGNLRAQVTWDYSQGFATVPTAANLQQKRVADFNVFNMFMKYDVNGSGIGKDLSFTLNVDNIFDVSPPLFRGAAASLFGVSNGFTLGRVVKLGAGIKF
jgi:iron complex outermembrane receptor protein